jgi:hypothetical protein
LKYINYMLNNTTVEINNNYESFLIRRANQLDIKKSNKL